MKVLPTTASTAIERGHVQYGLRTSVKDGVKEINMRAMSTRANSLYAKPL